MHFGTELSCKSDFLLFEKIIKDRGSVYSVSVGKVLSREDANKFLKKVKSNKKYRKATHNTYALRIAKEGKIYESKSDDGEAGAGNVILRVLQKKDFVNTIVCVTRWFGGTKLYADRFKHVQDATLYALEKVEEFQKEKN